MTADTPHVENLDDHLFLVSVGEGDDRVSVRFYADPDFVDLVGGGTADERWIVEAATDFLLRHQRADDLPDTVDLAAVAAAYDDFVIDIRDRAANRRS
jgi:hypothetical protein